LESNYVEKGHPAFAVMFIYKKKQGWKYIFHASVGAFLELRQSTQRSCGDDWLLCKKVVGSVSYKELPE
jgi:hypothetical protein